MQTHVQTVDVLVIGGGTAGPMAAAKAKEADPSLRVLLLEKANVKRSGAISMGMDGLNNAVVPGFATPEQYVKEITIANDGIVDQRTVMAYARNSYAMIEELDSWGVKFEKDETGDYAMRKVHHMGTYVLPMPEGHDIKKVLYRRLKRARVEITNRLVATRLLTAEDGAVAGAMAFDCRSGDFHVIRAKSVVLATGAAGRLGLPASGYLFGTYENPTNAGDGYSMAYHAGAELSGIECFQINPLIKDYNGPACAYVTGPFGGHTTNGKGERFVECDYWSGQMMQEFYNELQGGNGPVFLKMNHLAEETIQTIETILHTNERPSRGRFHAGRGLDYRSQMVEMHISEIGLCSGHSASGVWVDAQARTTVPGLHAAGDLACVPHNYMLGAFVYGRLAGESAARYCAENALPALDDAQVERERARVWAPLQREDGLPPAQVEYKLRRMVNDYLQPPKVTRKMEIGLQRFEAIGQDLDRLQARNPHELMREQHLKASVWRVFAGFAAAAATGIALGLVIGRSRLLEDLLLPPLEVLRPIPAVAWIPLAILMFPSSEMSMVYITFIGALFPILLNTIHGVEGVDPRLVASARSLGAGRWTIFTEVILPAAAPSIVTGLSIGMGTAWFCLVTAEMISGQFGIGYYTWASYTIQNYPEIVVGMLFIGVIGMGSSVLVKKTGNLFLPWYLMQRTKR